MGQFLKEKREAANREREAAIEKERQEREKMCSKHATILNEICLEKYFNQYWRNGYETGNRFVALKPQGSGYYIKIRLFYSPIDEKLSRSKRNDLPFTFFQCDRRINKKDVRFSTLQVEDDRSRSTNRRLVPDKAWTNSSYTHPAYYVSANNPSKTRRNRITYGKRKYRKQCFEQLKQDGYVVFKLSNKRNATYDHVVEMN